MAASFCSLFPKRHTGVLAVPLAAMPAAGGFMCVATSKATFFSPPSRLPDMLCHVLDTFPCCPVLLAPLSIESCPGMSRMCLFSELSASWVDRFSVAVDRVPFPLQLSLASCSMSTVSEQMCTRLSCNHQLTTPVRNRLPQLSTIPAHALRYEQI